jgi:hypothetical protein
MTAAEVGDPVADLAPYGFDFDIVGTSGTITFTATRSVPARS